MTKRAERIKKDIIKIYSSVNKNPANVASEYSTLYQEACKVFGSWSNALNACGIDYYKVRNNEKWSRERILKTIIDRHDQGKSLQPSRLRNNGNTKLLSAANYHFGSWRKAVEAGGIEYSYGRNSRLE